MNTIWISAQIDGLRDEWMDKLKLEPGLAGLIKEKNKLNLLA